ncbi:glyoxalase/bleomycin resistance/dioxygenase family protein [Hylemonella gracilis]|uniref:Glyoxalase/bleomycin resistance/dioxygenase family protein n=1 Tax=Hylemonella gracilis TaxID=80880 RepID=A0A4P6UKA6_9BURK|nr:ArsI/CadI family heavy metal resistance metalloenzyme [Hylemonella gracilis]QBK05513.1 glyoxalase/bleomycin resistance/dioxygenase family protein [Hylemonella gracilis]
MKRFHVHLHVQDLNQNVTFYSALFGLAPARTESDYAKWMLQDPPVNFAISTRGAQTGLDHLGFQVESDEELRALKSRAEQAELALRDEGETTCCYTRSNKYWLTDPQGLAWEQFHTLDHIPTFSATADTNAAIACCPPAAKAAPRGKPVGIAVKSTSSCC